MYTVDVDWAPPYELAASLGAFVSRSDRKTLELGGDWFRRVRQQLRPELQAEFSSRKHSRVLPLTPLIRQCPGERGVESFLAWLGALSVGELYERISPGVADDATDVLHDLGGQRDWTVYILTAWHEQYFRHVDEAILRGLRDDAEAKRALIATMSPELLVELATNGLQLDAGDVPDMVVLVPQYHYRPWNVYDVERDTWFIEYPSDALPTVPGEPPARLLRLARALSDDSRLRILHHLAAHPRSFTEIQRFTGLSKSTVHHHMVTLRAAGLIRVRGPWAKGTRAEKYILRPETIDDLGESVKAFLAMS